MTDKKTHTTELGRKIIQTKHIAQQTERTIYRIRTIYRDLKRGHSRERDVNYQTESSKLRMSQTTISKIIIFISSQNISILKRK